MIECTCGKDQCESQIYVQEDGITVKFNPAFGGAAIGDLMLYVDDAQLKQLVRDALAALRERGEKSLLSELGLAVAV